PLWAPFVWISWRLGERLDALTVVKALALSIAWALLIGVISAALFITSVSEASDWPLLVISGTIFIVQAALLAIAIHSWRRFVPRRSHKGVLVVRMGLAVLVVLGCALVVPNFIVQEGPTIESSAVGSLRTILTAQISYRHDSLTGGFA